MHGRTQKGIFLVISQQASNHYGIIQQRLKQHLAGLQCLCQVLVQILQAQELDCKARETHGQFRATAMGTIIANPARQQSSR